MQVSNTNVNTIRYRWAPPPYMRIFEIVDVDERDVMVMDRDPCGPDRLKVMDRATFEAGVREAQAFFKTRDACS